MFSKILKFSIENGKKSSVSVPDYAGYYGVSVSLSLYISAY